MIQEKDNLKLIEEFLNYLSSLSKSESTRIAYKKDISQLAQTLPSTSLSLLQITEAQLKSSLSKLTAANSFTAKTVSRKINSYRTFYKYLQENNLITVNPALKLQHPKSVSRASRILTPMEYLALKECSRHNLRLYTMIEVLLQTGLRISELSRVKIEDVKLNKTNPEIEVKAFENTNGRYVTLNNKALKALQAYLETRKVLPSSPLFGTKDNNPIIIRNIRASIDSCMQKAGVINACVNDLRNTFIYQQLLNGVKIDVVSKTVGHKSDSSTLKYYKLLPKDFKKEKVSKILDI